MNQPPQKNSEALRDSAHRLDEQLASTMPLQPVPSRPWQEADYHPAAYLKAGLLAGALAGCTSLLFNVVGSLFGPGVSNGDLHPLRLIQVYLTFPLGAAALQLNAGMTLALGCVLYLITGVIYGTLFELTLSYFISNAGLLIRLASCSMLGLLLWCVNFYGILIWLQPLLFDGQWIIELLPWWVAALTHLIFAWTVAVVYPLARSVSHR